MSHVRCNAGTEATLHAGWFNTDSAVKFAESTWFDGANQVSNATASQWDHEDLYYTKKGRWILGCWSQRQGTQDRFSLIDQEDAFEWLIAHEHISDGDLPEGLPESVLSKLREAYDAVEL